MPFQIIRNDITKVHADAIVNSANPKPVYASGTDSAVYQAAGAEKLLAERRKIGSIPRGEVAVTEAFDLPAKYIIHTVGPVWEDGAHGELEQLASCYRKSLLIAKQLGCESIAFPLISTGVYGFPKDKALAVALETIANFLNDSDSEMDVTLVVFDKKAFELSSALTADVSQFIDDHYVEKKNEEEYAFARPPRGNRPYGNAASGMASYEQAAAAGSGESARKKSRRRIWEERRRRRRIEEEEPAFSAPESGEWQEEELAAEAEEDLAMSPAPAMEAPSMEAPAMEAPSMEEPAKEALSIETPAKEAPEKEAPPKLPSPAWKKEQKKSSVSAQKEDPWSGRTLDEILAQAGESFRDCLFRLIDERGLKDSVVYKRANVDRKVFSKIRRNEDYLPKKGTALALAIALELNLDQTKDLLGKAGLALSDSNKTDLIIEYCIIKRMYNIFDVNAVLFEYDQPSIGACSQ